MAVPHTLSKQHGVTLLVCLVMLIVVMLLGASAAQLALQGEKAARGERDREIAFQAAEDALADAERNIKAGHSATAPATCGASPQWQRVDLPSDEGGCTESYGAVMPTGAGFLPFKKPRYLIERSECHQPGDDASADAATSHCYRVTAIGFGPRPATEVVLQSIFNQPE